MNDRTAARRAVARAGEDAACDFLCAHGYQIVERNFYAAGGEIDVVARRATLLVFAEVKARSSARYGAPCEAVGALKAARIKRCAAAWLRARHPGRVEVRFDVLSVMVCGRRTEVTHIPAAF